MRWARYDNVGTPAYAVVEGDTLSPSAAPHSPPGNARKPLFPSRRRS